MSVWCKQVYYSQIEIAWSELSAVEDAEILQVIDKYWDEFNSLIDDVFAGRKMDIWLYILLMVVRLWFRYHCFLILNV